MRDPGMVLGPVKMNQILDAKPKRFARIEKMVTGFGNWLNPLAPIGAALVRSAATEYAHSTRGTVLDLV